MNKRELLVETFPEGEFLCADGLDEAIIGIDELTDRVIYDIDKCIEILAQDMDIDPDDIQEGMTEHDARHEMAREYFYYNTAGAYVGPQTPIFMQRL